MASPARRLKPEDARKLMTEQAALTALTKHPSWPTLVSVVDDKLQRMERVALANILTRDGLDSRDAHFLRGFREGIRYMLAVCDGAERRLEGVLKAHGVPTEGE